LSDFFLGEGIFPYDPVLRQGRSQRAAKIVVDVVVGRRRRRRRGTDRPFRMFGDLDSARV
jgi:hypothetical protein